MQRVFAITLLTGTLAAVLFGHAIASPQAPGAPAVRARIMFSKEFPGSAPPYYSVTVDEEGSAVYATAPDDPQPVLFRLSAPVVKQLFEIAARLNYFRGAQFEAKRKVASMGKKTLRYQSQSENYEASFNYSDNPDAMALAGFFEKISTTEQHLINLEKAVRFDRLGVMKQLLQIEITMNKNELVEPAQFVPLLERVSGSSNYMNIARERANHLLQRIRSAAPVTAANERQP